MNRSVACGLLAIALIPLRAQNGGLAPRAAEGPSARLVSAPALTIPAKADSNIPLVWDLVDGVPTLFAFASWGGTPAMLAGPEVGALREIGTVTLIPGAGHGVWIEAVVADDVGTWYGYYHHEVPAEKCGRPDRTIVSIGAARSRDRGVTWDNLGIVLEAPPDGEACASTNHLLLGGVGDPTAILDANRRYLYLYFSQYSQAPSAQGVAIARMPWADRDAPAGALAVLGDGAWLPARLADGDGPRWEYPAGTALVPVGNPWHNGDNAVDAYWGASIHWNTYLERYVMLLNRAKNENFDNEGLYVSYAPAVDIPTAWSAPQKLMNGGGWYPEAVGLEAGGTDKEAGQRARFFITGRSNHYIEFSR